MREKRNIRGCIKIETWNIRTLTKGGTFENLKEKMEKISVSVLGVSEVRWKEQGEIRSGDYTMYCCGGGKAERDVDILVHTNTVRSVVNPLALELDI